MESEGNVAEQASPQMREAVVWMISVDQERGELFMTPLGGKAERQGTPQVSNKLKGGGSIIIPCMS